MPISVVIAGSTGWVGRALVPAVASADDLALAAAVAPSAAGRDAGEAVGLAPAGVMIARTLGEALDGLPAGGVVVDYTRPGAVMGNTLLALSRGFHVVIGTSGLGAEDYAQIDAAAQTARLGVIAAGNFSVTAALMKRFALEAAKYVATWR
ncbi:hypothetical protein [Methylobrevis pamukkalensis]|uniref:4-hydroxy-tetrahydrodipicolinate reductase n=1 Tax=Methylobrevis pamukkalensis TaxID=1439726 RepID=A0A1E3H2L7_9HYPH|nr:4-hydroxy-tetrahydrodipicolinate reductase [Methylobrevis pamukkalensis]